MFGKLLWRFQRRRNSQRNRLAHTAQCVGAVPVTFPAQPTSNNIRFDPRPSPNDRLMRHFGVKYKTMDPSLNGQNGRDAKGRFTKGNSGGPGNPLAKQVNRLRSALVNAVDESDVEAIITAMVEKAQAGDVAAARLILEYAAGKPTPIEDTDGDHPFEFVFNFSGDAPRPPAEKGQPPHSHRRSVTNIAQATADQRNRYPLNEIEE